MTLPNDYVPWPGRQRIETVLVDLELGVSMTQPCWQWHIAPDGRQVPGVDARLPSPSTWYVDLVHITAEDGRIDVLDQYVDIMVSTDGRQARTLDFDEFADALEAGDLTVTQAANALRRWQSFLDRHLYPHRDPRREFADFPPRRLLAVADVHRTRNDQP